MSKICNRDYSDGSMLTVKVINAVECCPNCEKPAVCHNKPIEQRALFWALSGDTGSSSEAIAAHMTHNPGNARFGMMPPSDGADRGRCIRLLELIPEWIDRLPEMAQYDKGRSTGIVISAAGIGRDSNTWAQQIPFIIKEGGF
jgi:hypothetical protein